MKKHIIEQVLNQYRTPKPGEIINSELARKIILAMWSDDIKNVIEQNRADIELRYQKKHDRLTL